MERKKRSVKQEIEEKEEKTLKGEKRIRIISKSNRRKIKVKKK
jgi:hypothetical protein